MNRTVSRRDNTSTPSDSSPLRKKPTRFPIRQQTSAAEVEDRPLKIEIGNNHKQITLVIEEIYLAMKLKQGQDPE